MKLADCRGGVASLPAHVKCALDFRGHPACLALLTIAASGTVTSINPLTHRQLVRAELFRNALPPTYTPELLRVVPNTTMALLVLHHPRPENATGHPVHTCTCPRCCAVRRVPVPASGPLWPRASNPTWLCVAPRW